MSVTITSGFALRIRPENVTNLHRKKLLTESYEVMGNHVDLRSSFSILLGVKSLTSMPLNCQVWPYLLGHYVFGSTADDRRALDATTRQNYETTMSEWLAVEAIVRQRDKETMAANLAKLSSESTSGEAPPPTPNLQHDLSNDVREPLQALQGPKRSALLSSLKACGTLTPSVIGGFSLCCPPTGVRGQREPVGRRQRPRRRGRRGAQRLPGQRG